LNEEKQPQSEAEEPAQAEEAKPAEGAGQATANPAPAEATAGAAWQPPTAPAITTPIASPTPAPRPLLSRRVFILGGFWSAFALGAIGILGSPLDFLFPRNVKGFGGPVTVPAGKIPEAGNDPVRIVEGKFWLLNLKPGTTPNGEETPGGLLALWQKCPHLGCTIPWRSDFTFAGRKGWFRCPCHGSTYTKEGGVRVFGPAPRPMDVFDITDIKDDGSIVVQTGPGFKGTGSADNPSKTKPYPA
jgi:cytochrome b6-f complex iron-sulfur subunit